MIVTDEDVQKWLDWLRDSIRQIGHARAEAVKADYMLKHVKAIGMALHKDSPGYVQEREAYASQAYLDALERAADTAGKYEEIKASRETALVTIEAWRSASANYRAMKI